MIRLATKQDFPSLKVLGRKFWEQTHFKNSVPFIDEDAEGILEDCLSANLLFVAELENKIIGFIGGISFPSMVNSKVLFGQEVFWFVNDEHRSTGAGLKLLKAIETSAKNQGVLYWGMSHLTIIEPEKMAKLYHSLGYFPAENTFIKEL